MAKSPITEQEEQELRKFAQFLSLNTGRKKGRRAVKITVQFEHGVFDDNKRFASITLPKGNWSMARLVQALEARTTSILDGSDITENFSHVPGMDQQE